jgi:uncharacterized membrane protein YdbT with pleckstrin-like domain
MTKYPSSLLSEGEVVQFQLRPHFRALFVPFLWLALAVGIMVFGAMWAFDTFLRIPLLVAAAAVFLLGTTVPFLRWLTTQYVFTNRRIITREGILTRNGRDMPLARVNNVSFEQSFMGRILNYGDLEVTSASDESLVIRDVPSVERIQRQVYDLYEEDDARRRGATPSDGI